MEKEKMNKHERFENFMDKFSDITTITYKNIVAFIKIATFLYISYSTYSNLANDNIVQGLFWFTLGFVLYMPKLYLKLLVKLGIEEDYKN